MVRGSSASLLLLYAVLSCSNSQLKEYDCPDTSLCTEKPSFENRNVLECKLDSECGITQKCCKSCKYGFKICTDIAENEYLTNQDEYLKNKYCPKVKPCFTPLKYNPTYRCWSDEACSYGYKCCKSDCYIHKVCVVPIDNEGLEAAPPPTTTTSTTATEEIISTVFTTIKVPLHTTTTLATTPEEASSTKLPKTTLFLTEESTEFSGKEVTVTKQPATTSTHQTHETTTKIQPITTSSRQTTVPPASTTAFQEASTKRPESIEIDASGDGFTDDEDIETLRPNITSRHTTASPAVSTIAQLTSMTTRGLTEVGTSVNRFTDDGEEGIGSGSKEMTQTPRPNTTRQSTVLPVVVVTNPPPHQTTIIQETTIKLLTETSRPITTSSRQTSAVTTTFPSMKTQGSIEIDASGDGFTDDDNDGDDLEDTEEPETHRPNVTSRHTTASTIAQSTSMTTRGSTDVGTSGNIFTDDGEEGIDSSSKEETQTPRPNTTRQSTVLPVVVVTNLPPHQTTIIQETTTKLLTETSRPITTTKHQASIEIDASGDGFTDDDNEGDDVEDTEEPETPRPSKTSRQTTFSLGVTITAQKPPTKNEGSTEIVTSGDGAHSKDTATAQPITATSRFVTVSPAATTKVQQTIRDLTASGDEFTKDNDNGDVEKIETRPITTTSTFSTKSSTFTRKQGESDNGTTEEAATTNTLRETADFMTTIHQQIPESTEFVGSGDGSTDDDEDGDEDDQNTDRDTESTISANKPSEKPTTGSSEPIESTPHFTKNGEDSTTRVFENASKLTEVSNATRKEGQTIDFTSSGHGPSINANDSTDEDDKSKIDELVTGSHFNLTTPTPITDFEFVEETKSQAAASSQLISKSTEIHALSTTTGAGANGSRDDSETSQTTFLTRTTSNSDSREELTSTSSNRTTSIPEGLISKATSIGDSLKSSTSTRKLEQLDKQATDLDYDMDIRALAITTKKEFSGLATVTQPPSPVTPKRNITEKSKSPSTPTPVDFDYDGEVNTPATPNKNGWVSSEEQKNQTMKTSFNQKDSSHITNRPSQTHDLSYTGSTPNGNEIGSTEAKKPSDNSSSFVPQQAALSNDRLQPTLSVNGNTDLMEGGSGYDHNDIDENHDDEDNHDYNNRDDVDEDIRFNFTNRMQESP